MKFLSLVILLFVLSETIFPKSSSADSALYEYNPLYRQHIEMYKVYKTKRADIVMLGNSITHGTNWNGLLGEKI
jgi:hypothetical protein